MTDSLDDKIYVTATPTAVTATLPCHNPDGSLWNMLLVITPRSRRRNPTVELYGGEVRYKLDALDPANASARARFLKSGIHPEYHTYASALLTRATDEFLGQQWQ
jgi:hypothetical protein